MKKIDIVAFLGGRNYEVVVGRVVAGGAAHKEDCISMTVSDGGTFDMPKYS